MSEKTPDLPAGWRLEAWGSFYGPDDPGVQIDGPDADGDVEVCRDYDGGTISIYIPLAVLVAFVKKYENSKETGA